jgi:hypothetical protein
MGENFPSESTRRRSPGRSEIHHRTGDGGVLLPDDKCSKNGLPIADVLESKHQHARSPDANVLPHYKHVPEFIEVNITEDAVEKTARKLSGGSGLGGVDSYTLKHWLLGFGRVSRALRNTVADFVSWLANDIPPWAAMRALRADRLIALEKNPGVRPVGIGETWSRLFSKTVLLLTLDEPKAACGADQLCSGLKAGIEGAIHASQVVWDQHSNKERWGFLLIDAQNSFNECKIGQSCCGLLVL